MNWFNRRIWRKISVAIDLIRKNQRFFSGQSVTNESDLSRDDITQRYLIAQRYLKGDGIEIGALHNPLKVPTTARVKCLDRMSTESLRQHYPELNEVPLVSVDIIDDGESLSTLKAASQDFVIANHFIEHCQNPIKAVANMLRVLKNGGFLYLSIPDKRYTFDRDRPVTAMDHIVRDFNDGPEWSRKAAFEEYVRFVDKIKDEAEANKKVAQYMAMDYSIHYHAWTEIEMQELIIFLRRNREIPFIVDLVLKNDVEIIMIIRKGSWFRILCSLLSKSRK